MRALCGGPCDDGPTTAVDSGDAPETEPDPQPANVDPSSDDAVRAAYEKATGRELDERDGCIGHTGVGRQLLRKALALAGWKPRAC